MSAYAQPPPQGYEDYVSVAQRPPVDEAEVLLLTQAMRHECSGWSLPAPAPHTTRAAVSRFLRLALAVCVRA